MVDPAGNMRLAISIAIVFITATAGAAAEALIGIASVIDGDTIELQGERVPLSSAQTVIGCSTVDDPRWRLRNSGGRWMLPRMNKHRIEHFASAPKPIQRRLRVHWPS
jgi:endonuclease YncB( thermonuclease family)